MARFAASVPGSGSSGPPIKLFVIIGLILTGLIVTLTLFSKLTGLNDTQNWQVWQSVFGKVEIIDSSGYYMKNFGKVWVYPRSIQTFYSAHPSEGTSKDESIGVTFNDGGTAKISSMVRFDMPTDPEHRLKLHRTFGDVNQWQAVKDAVRAHLVNVLKNSAPIMSASENQAGRKSEFNRIVEEQLRHGLYEMRVFSKTLHDQTDQKGLPVTVYATEIIVDDKGAPRVQQLSPLDEYGITVTQFSVTGTDYDPDTMLQFAAKKQSFLAAEKSKAEREQEVQLRLMTVEKGLREKAEVEAVANKEKATAVIAAQKGAEVAEKTKLEADTKAQQGLSVAKIAKEEAETKANQLLEVAKINAQAAEQNAIAIKTLASAEAEKILKAGSITEKERTLAEIKKDRDIRVAQYLAQIRTPSVVFNGGGGATGSDPQASLMNLIFLRLAGIDFKTMQPADAPAAK